MPGEEETADTARSTFLFPVIIVVYFPFLLAAGALAVVCVPGIVLGWI